MATRSLTNEDSKSTADGFKYNGVGSKGKGKQRQKEQSSRASGGTHVERQEGAPQDEAEAFFLGIRDSIERKRKELLRGGKHGSLVQSCLSSYFSFLRRDHGNGQPSSSRLPTRIYALGIGEISQSRSAQVQVALLLEMADHIVRIAEGQQGGSELASDPRPALMAFDPIFSATDRAVLTSLGVTPLTREEASAQACYEATFPSSAEENAAATAAHQGGYTLMYMPHCPRPLSERYLRAFWSKEALLDRRVTFCWNRVGRYAEFLTDEKLNRESPCLYRIIPHLKSHPLPSLSPPYAEALNDLVFEYICDPDEKIDRTTEGTATSDAQDGSTRDELADDLSKLQLSNTTLLETHASHTSPPAQGHGQAPDADEAPEEVEFTVQVTRKKKKRRPQRNGSAMEEARAVVRPDIRSEEFWQLPRVFEGGEGSEEIL